MKYQENPALAKKLKPFAIVISIIVLVLVFSMDMVHVSVDADLSMLPPFHATLNVIVFIMLLLALYFVKKKNIAAHQKAIYAAMACSFIFLCSYVTYHICTPHTLYCKHDWTRKLYFFILFSHIAMAAFSFPMILFAFIRGISFQVEKHKKLVRYVYPMWLYVALTGPIVYLMLRPCY